MLPNGNMFVGWGFIREVTEFHLNGTILFHAKLSNSEEPQAANYREFKHPWVGMPAQPPKLLAYSHYCDRSLNSPLIAYVTWNGATEVANWRFFTSESPEGPWIHAKTSNKDDFETRALLADHFHPYVNVEALDKFGKVLSTVSATTFVPSELALQGCDDHGCFQEEYFTYDRQYSRAESCEQRNQGSLTLYIMVLVLLLFCNERFGWPLKRIRSARLEGG